MDSSPKFSCHNDEFLNFRIRPTINILSAGTLEFSPGGIISLRIQCIQKPSYIRILFLQWLLGAKWISNETEVYIQTYEEKESILKRYPKAKFKE